MPPNVYHLIEKVSNEIDFKLALHDFYLVHLHRDLSQGDFENYRSIDSLYFEALYFLHILMFGK